MIEGVSGRMEPAPGIEMPRTMFASTHLQAIHRYLTLLLTVQTSSRASVRDPGRCRTVVVCQSTASTRCFWNLRQGSSAATPLVFRWRPPTRRAHRFTFSLCQVSPLPRPSIESVMNIVRVQFKVDGCMQNFNV